MNSTFASFYLDAKNVLLNKHLAIPQKNEIYGIFRETRCGVLAND
jgi:hypothetical protein